LDARGGGVKKQRLRGTEASKERDREGHCRKIGKRREASAIMAMKNY